MDYLKQVLNIKLNINIKKKKKKKFFYLYIYIKINKVKYHDNIFSFSIYFSIYVDLLHGFILTSILKVLFLKSINLPISYQKKYL